MKRGISVLLLVALLAGIRISVLRAQEDNRCPEVEHYPNNLVVNCSFERGWVPIQLGEIGEGWEYFMESGQPALDHSTFERLHGATAQRIWTDGVAFTASIYQQVEGVAPGATYVAAVDWAAINPSKENNIERKIGIDPSGGRDPTSPYVVWSPSLRDWGHDFSALRVSVMAEAGTITVFVRVSVPSSEGTDEAFIDLVHLERDATQPVATSTPEPPSPTPTSAPPTATSTPLPATDTPTPTDTVPIPSDTPTPTSSPTATPTPSSTPTFTPTPVPLVVPESLPNTVLTPIPATPASSETSLSIPRILLGVALFSFVGAGALGGVLMLLRRSQLFT